MEIERPVPPGRLTVALLGIHISVAVAWQRASSGDWTSYAADVSRRRNGSAEPSEGAPRTLT